MSFAPGYQDARLGAKVGAVRKVPAKWRGGTSVYSICSSYQLQGPIIT